MGNVMTWGRDVFCGKGSQMQGLGRGVAGDGKKFYGDGAGMGLISTTVLQQKHARAYSLTKRPIPIKKHLQT